MSALYVNTNDLKRFTTSETTSWIRPYFTQHEKRPFLRPCGRSLSCQQISTEVLSSSSTPTTTLPTKKAPPNGCDTSSSSSPIGKGSFSSCMISIKLPTGESIHLPLPQKHARKSSTALISKSLIKNRVHFIQSTAAPVDIGKQSMNAINCLSSSYLY